jgi:stearoyl-CoA desaturase (delta-9 desaturase)
MKYLAASAYSVSFMQLFGLLGSIIGLSLYSLDLSSILMIIIGYFLYSGIGISMMYHRYYTHRSFEFKHDWVRKLCLSFAIFAGRGSPIGWVYVHRLHHAFSDTDKDPHDPIRYGWRIFFPHLLHYGETVNKKIIKDLFNREHVDINKYYNLFLLSWVVLLSLISFKVLFFFYCVPLLLSAIALDLFVYLSHSYGYRNHDTRDNSKNNWFISLILWGEGWHNNHHKNPASYTTQEKWYEFDMLKHVIRMVSK